MKAFYLFPLILFINRVAKGINVETPSPSSSTVNPSSREEGIF